MTERAARTDGDPRPGDGALRGFRRWCAAQIDRFVPRQFEPDSDPARRARILIGYSFLGAGPGAIFFALALVNYKMPLVTLFTGTTLLVTVLTPFVLRRTGSLALASSGMFAAMVWSTLVASGSADGQPLVTLPWLAVVPLMATAIAGRAAGVGWAVVCTALSEGLLVLEERGDLPHQTIPADALRAGTSWNIALLIAVVLIFALLSESLRMRTMRALADAQARLDAAREKALHADRLASLGQMAAGVAHEINNPMAFVSSNVTLLREDLARGPLDPALQREYVDDILPATEEGIRRMIGIVGDLRRFARGDTAESVEFDFNGEVKTALRMSEKALGDRRLVVSLGSVAPLVGRPREISQVTMNLVLNAAHATGRDGEIRVATRTEGDDVVLLVEDDGTGMTPSVQAHIFEPFFTTKPAGEGTGLGLAVVHGIVRAHGGSVLVDTAPGRGSRFEVRIPARGGGGGGATEGGGGRSGA